MVTIQNFEQRALYKPFFITKIIWFITSTFTNWMCSLNDVMKSFVKELGVISDNKDVYVEPYPSLNTTGEFYQGIT